MANFVKDFIQSAEKQFLKNKKYIEVKDWTVEKEEEEEGDFYKKNKKRLEEFNLQNDLASGILERVKYFVKKTSGIKRTKKALDFIKDSLNIVELHTNRVDFYINNMDISEIEESSMRADEVSFHNHCFKAVSKLMDNISGLDVNYEDETNSNTSGIEFLNNSKAPLSMHSILSKLYPQINNSLKEKGIDFDSKPDNKLLFLNPKPPEWDANLHYWEQDKKTLQFYVDEFKKLQYGIVIDGVYFSPWAYYHLNVFITPIPHKEWDENSQEFKSKDYKINPPLRDSDWMIFENRNRQIKEKYLMMFIAATRRAAKTTAETSVLGHGSTIGLGELLCAGSSSKDLNQIRKNFKVDNENKNPAFAVPVITNDWKDKVEFGIKTKSNKSIILSTLYIINTDGGNSKEIFAGFTPDLLVYDEVMKSAFIESLEGALPALRGLDGTVRCFPILSGTGGSEELSADGWKVLASPEVYDVMPMQWDILERGVPKEAITWEEDKAKPFGTFIPGQCRVDMPKIESNLAEYLGVNSEYLKKVPIKLTDWVEAKRIIEQRRDLVTGDKIKHQKEVVYSPITPSDIFLSGALNPFPVAEAKAHKQYLIETGKWDKRRSIYRDSMGKICFDISTKDLADFPHKGGNVDAPALIFEYPPEQNAKFGTFTAGFDDYKHESSDSSSVSTFYIFKNEILGDPYSKKVVASISFRPDRHSDVHEKWLMLMEAYNLEATCFGENEDMAIKDYLDKKHLTEKYLAQGLDFSQTFNLANNLRRKYGWSPQTSKKTLFRLFVEYCNEEFVFEMEDGTMKTMKGVQRIDDIGLLDEIIQYNTNLNVDRITAMMGAVGYAHYLTSSFLFKPPTYTNETDKGTTKRVQKKREKSFYGGNERNKSFYSKGRR